MDLLYIFPYFNINIYLFPFCAINFKKKKTEATNLVLLLIY
jgi:hypothetical protein